MENSDVEVHGQKLKIYFGIYLPPSRFKSCFYMDCVCFHLLLNCYQLICSLRESTWKVSHFTMFYECCGLFLWMEKIKSLLYKSSSSEIKETQVTVVFLFFVLNKRVVKSRPLDFLIFLVGQSIFPKDNNSIKDSKKVLWFQLED